MNALRILMDEYRQDGSDIEVKIKDGEYYKDLLDALELINNFDQDQLEVTKAVVDDLIFGN